MGRFTTVLVGKREFHAVPVMDIKDHTYSRKCACRPEVIDEEARELVQHRSFFYELQQSFES